MENNKYSLTVIIPNYNKEKYLEKCINSIINQTYKDIYIIVVDDCSTDNSYKLLKKLEKKYSNLKVFKNEKNSGVSFSRNFGIDVSETNYITFLDSDDFYFNNKKIENEMNLIIEYKEKYNKDIAVYSKIVHISNDESIVRYPSVNKYLNGYIYDKLITGESFELRDYCFKKDIINKSGNYDVNSNFYEDLDLLIRISKYFEFYCTNELGTAYRDSLNGLSKKSRYASYRARKDIYIKYISSLPFLKAFLFLIKMYLTFFITLIKNIIRKIFKIIRRNV